ncbi:MAG: hypothetical protein V1787_04425 [Candidatus Micrarchaeota archaeon]
MVGVSITDAVAEVLDDLHSVRPALRDGLVNFSALARHIKPLIKARLGAEEVSDDAIIMAIRRYVEKVLLKDRPDTTLDELVKCSLLLREQMVNLHFIRSEKLYRRLIDFETRKVDWGKGEKLYIIQRTEEISVIASSKFADDLVKLADKKDVLMLIENLALLSVAYDIGGVETPGMFRFFVDRLEDINIAGMFSTFSMISFLVAEADSAKAYERLNRGLLQLRNQGRLKQQRERFIHEE